MVQEREKVDEEQCKELSLKVVTKEQFISEH
jgi:hypothetical protein